jgi:hypothetical protein
MSIKEEIDKLVSAELSKIEKGSETFSDYIDKQRQVFAPMKVVLKEICSAIDEKYIECQLEDYMAGIKLINSSVYTRWKIMPNCTSQRDEDGNVIDYSFNKENKYVVDDSINRFEYFKDEAAVSEYLLKKIAKHIARKTHWV